MKPLKVVLVTLAIVFATSSTVGATLATNGGFETIIEGDKFPGWIYSGPTPYWSGVTDLTYHWGTHAAYFSTAYSWAPEYITQNIATTPGQEYTVKFWLKPQEDSHDLGFTALWNNVPIEGLTLSTDTNWVEYSYTRVATGATTPISFGFSRSWGNGWNFDDVSANPASVVPIPGAVWLLGSGLAGLVGIGRWRKRK